MNDSENLQKALEKLIDWELRKQLQWTAFFFATVLGMISLLGSDLLTQVEFPFSCIYFSIYFLFYIPMDYSFYRMAVSVSIMRNYFEDLPNERMQDELVRNARGKKLFDWFAVENENDKKWHPRKWRIGFLVVAANVLFFFAFVSRFRGYY